LKIFKIIIFNNINNLILNIIKNYYELMILQFYSSNIGLRLDIATLKFSLLSNFIALIGGKIKSKQMISGNMSDILSNLYLSYSILWYHKHYLSSNNITGNIIRNECLNYLINELDYKINLVIANYDIPLLKPLLYPLINKITYPKLENKNKLYSIIINNNEFNNILKNDIYYKGTVLEKMEKLKQLDPKTNEYKKLYEDIISVGEFTI